MTADRITDDRDAAAGRAAPSLRGGPWSGILAGVFVALACLAVFGAIGLALLLAGGGSVAGTPGMEGRARLAWLAGSAVGLLASLFLGGCVAARLAGPVPRIEGALCGLVVWAVVVVAGGSLAALAAARAADAAAEFATGAIAAAERMAATAAETAYRLAGAGLPLTSALPADALGSAALDLARQAATRPDAMLDRLDAAVEGAGRVVSEVPRTAPTAVRPGLTGPPLDEAAIVDLIAQQTGAPVARAAEGLAEWRAAMTATGPGLLDRAAAALRAATGELRAKTAHRLRRASDLVAVLASLAALGMAGSAAAAVVGGALGASGRSPASGSPPRAGGAEPRAAQAATGARFGAAAAPAIADYAMIGDCRTVALVSREGSIDWLCLPHFSGPSAFAALLDAEKGGRFAIRPSGRFTVERRYRGTTAVLETTFRTESGAVRVIDLMPVADGFRALAPMREVLRIVEGVEGTVDLHILFAPRPDYARVAPRLERRGALGWAVAWGCEFLLLHTDAALEVTADGTAAEGALRVEAGRRHAFSLTYVRDDVGIIAPLGEAAVQRLQATEGWWRDWVAQCRYDGPHREAVLRSAVTLKLLTFAPSGAVVAAPTTSLPECIGGDRNWDYRFCWLRDAALTMRAFTGLGLQAEAKAFFAWLLHATRLTWPELQVMYDVYGRTRLDERRLDHLRGHGGSRPVRIGNAAHGQLQLDVYGEVVLAAHDYVASGGRLQRDEARTLVGIGRTVCRRWREPDYGIWEIRGSPRHYTFSKIMCWLALDRLLDLHERGLVRAPAERFRRERDAIEEVIETRGFNPALPGYASELDGDAADAALLLVACLGYRQATDPRMAATHKLLERRLAARERGLMLRYEPGYDRMPGEEGAFGVCGFWAVDNMLGRGEGEAAARRFAELLSCGNDLGLFAEETEPATGAALGNFPQAFTHVGLINAALGLAKRTG
ncbi:MAG TPA: glycoside hydrolase family 15 protein [Falsiroseomonas sp.]|jgi:GH15 family glucan-1,4-alpha-glucosidase|nr:glycoside hydrolase family 15 protein [Falsiroseomonas sp.]